MSRLQRQRNQRKNRSNEDFVNKFQQESRNSDRKSYLQVAIETLEGIKSGVVIQPQELDSESIILAKHLAYYQNFFYIQGNSRVLHSLYCSLLIETAALALDPVNYMHWMNNNSMMQRLSEKSLRGIQRLTKENFVDPRWKMPENTELLENAEGEWAEYKDFCRNSYYDLVQAGIILQKWYISTATFEPSLPIGSHVITFSGNGSWNLNSYEFLEGWTAGRAKNSSKYLVRLRDNSIIERSAEQMVEI